MADIRPFAALHYDAARVSGLDKVVTQPYDKITPEMQARYYDLSPYNLVRIIRGRTCPGDTAADNVYTRAAKAFHQWIAERVLVPDQTPAIYPYYQEYTVPGQAGVTRCRRGFIALLRLEDYSAGVVHRHEATLSAPRADRLELLRATRAHFGQIFLLYSDQTGALEAILEPAARSQPWESVTDEYGTRHRVWRLDAQELIEQLVALMREKEVVIADGHHRYETALAYRHECRARPGYDGRADYVMATFVRKETDGLTILPTHRVVHSLPAFEWESFRQAARACFDWQDTVWDASFLELLTRAGRERPSLGVYGGPGRTALLGLRPDVRLEAVLPDVAPGLRRLDVVLLHRLLLEGALGIGREAVEREANLRYVREWDTALSQVDRGEAQLAFLMNPTPIEAVWSNALAGNVLPQKSTDFYPKLLSGLTIYWLDQPACG